MGNAENPENPYSFLNFLNGHDEVAKSYQPDPMPSENLSRKMFSPSPAPSSKPPSKPGTPNQKSVYHMSMRELRDTLEAMQLRNAELEEKEFMTTQLGLKVDQLQAQLAMTENELQKSRKKCKRLHLELSESRYKEEQDTEDLDRMVKKVEKKLERSEARAAEAESELARTRSQITTCETDRVSWELSQSADNAEKLVKQMCNGIEGLRKIAASLASKNSR